MRIIRGTVVGAVSGAITLWAAGFLYACCATAWVGFTTPRPLERLFGVFLFGFVLLGLFWGSILGGICGALGGGVGGWSLGRSGGLRRRTVAAIGGFGNLTLMILVFTLVDHLAGPPPTSSTPLPARVLKLLLPLAALAAVGILPFGIGYTTARLRLRRAEADDESVRARHRPDDYWPSGNH